MTNKGTDADKWEQRRESFYHPPTEILRSFRPFLCKQTKRVLRRSLVIDKPSEWFSRKSSNGTRCLGCADWLAAKKEKPRRRDAFHGIPSRLHEWYHKRMDRQTARQVTNQHSNVDQSSIIYLGNSAHSTDRQFHFPKPLTIANLQMHFKSSMDSLHHPPCNIIHRQSVDLISLCGCFEGGTESRCNYRCFALRCDVVGWVSCCCCRSGAANF